jgi:hypothetical protein
VKQLDAITVHLVVKVVTATAAETTVMVEETAVFKL